MKPGLYDQPSPIHEDWELRAEVSPSTDWES